MAASIIPNGRLNHVRTSRRVRQASMTRLRREARRGRFDLKRDPMSSFKPRLVESKQWRAQFSSNGIVDTLLTA